MREGEACQNFVHPDKTEFICVGSRDSPFWKSEKFAAAKELKDFEAVRVLGAWVDRDGGAERDTAERIKAARKVWFRIRAQLARLPLSLKSKGRIFEAAVLGSLLYACEVRTFSAAQMRKFQSFTDKCLRDLQFNKLKSDLAEYGGKHDDGVHASKVWPEDHR